MKPPKPKRAGVSITERQFQQQVVQLARLCGWRCYHTHDSRRSEPGFPDLVLVRGRRVVFAELKVGKNKPTPEQEAWLAALREADEPEVYLWRPMDWDAIQTVLTGAP